MAELQGMVVGVRVVAGSPRATASGGGPGPRTVAGYRVGGGIRIRSPARRPAPFAYLGFQA